MLDISSKQCFSILEFQDSISRGEIILQQRRLGLQVFASVKFKHGLVNKARAARREASWEANVDMNDAAVIFISAPFLVTSACHMGVGRRRLQVVSRHS